MKSTRIGVSTGERVTAGAGGVWLDTTLEPRTMAAVPKAAARRFMSASPLRSHVGDAAACDDLYPKPMAECGPFFRVRLFGTDPSVLHDLCPLRCVGADLGCELSGCHGHRLQRELA